MGKRTQILLNLLSHHGRKMICQNSIFEYNDQLFQVGEE